MMTALNMYECFQFTRWNSEGLLTHLILVTTLRMGSIIPNLKKRKRRHRTIKGLAQGHAVKVGKEDSFLLKWKKRIGTQDSNPGSLATEATSCY